MAEWYSRDIAHETLRGCKENARTRDLESGYVYQNGGSAPFWLKPYKVLKGKDSQGLPFYRTYWAENTDILVFSNHSPKIYLYTILIT